MLRHRLAIAAAVVFAVLSAGSLGTGLVAIGPILQNILERNGEQGQLGLPGLAIDFNSRLPDWLSFARIPDETIQTLPPKPFTAVVFMVVTLGFLTILGGIANFLHQFCALSVVYRTIAEIRRAAFRAALRTPVLGIASVNSGDTVSRVINDAFAVGTGLTVLLSKALAQVTKGIVALVAAFIIDWRLSFFTFLAIPVLYTVIRRLAKKIRRASRTALESQARLYSATNEAFQGHRVVKVHTAERYESGRFGRINRDFTRELLKVRMARALSSPLVEVISILALGTLALVAAKAIIDGELSPERFIAAMFALGVAGASLKPLTGLVNEIQGSAAAATRVQELLDATPEPGLERGLPALGRHSKTIEFKGVGYTYPSAHRQALSGFDLRIEKGQTVALVGPNGSGKTTLLGLLTRLMEPQEGQILIDGRDISQHRVRSLRHQIGVVTQETVLFEGTIAENIAYGSWGASEEQIKAAAERARAAGFIESLPMGYKTRVGERGSGLSGGQRQRIAIARAVLRDPSILVLDEATSMIDSESEAAISAALAEFAAERTTVVVAHRLSTVMHADLIVVLDQGRIVATGTHSQLLESSDLYRRLAEHQLVST
jgi:ATP-binding cassette, subfamily B, bacterial MsbA